MIVRSKIRGRGVWFLACLCLACACSGQRRNPADIEEARRADLEVQSIMDMAFSKNIPPIDFETGSDALLASSVRVLDMVAEVLLSHPTLKLSVKGHTDDVGGDEYNKKLSLRRAGSVKAYLVMKGIHPESIRVHGYGRSMPAMEGTSRRSRAFNRRVEFQVTTRDWESVY